MDKKAKTILFKTYWSAQGWRDRNKRHTGPEDFAYAKAHGVMFDPVSFTHDECLRDLFALHEAIPSTKAAGAFLSSLSSRQLDCRSSLASYIIAGRLPPHSYSAVVSGHGYGHGGVITHTSYTCGVCRGVRGVIGNDRYDNVDLNVLNFERLKWGGIRRGKLDFTWFDLKQLERAEIPAPTAEDIAIFKGGSRLLHRSTMGYCGDTIPDRCLGSISRGQHHHNRLSSSIKGERKSMCDTYSKHADHLRVDPNERIVKNSEIDQQWADWLAPARRSFLFSAGAAALGLTLGEAADADEPTLARSGPAAAFAKLNGSITPYISADSGVSEWGQKTLEQPTVQPKGLWPGTENGLPAKPRAFTDIKSYHAHFYFDQDTHEKAALIRRWAGERFPVEMGDWNLQPRGPHTTPSFYFGFTNDLLPVVIPWVQLNSLGLTILLHPNTDDPRADHLYYTLWVNRSQPVNAFNMKTPRDQAGKAQIEKILPNVTPKVKLEI